MDNFNLAKEYYSNLDQNKSNSAIVLNEMKYELKLIESILAMLNISFIIFGTCGNLVTFSILMRKNVRKHSYMRYLASLCIIDTFCLYTWNFSIVYSYFQNKKIEHISPIYCRLFHSFAILFYNQALGSYVRLAWIEL